MADTGDDTEIGGKAEPTDPVYLSGVLPDLTNLFDQKQEPISKIKNDCMVVLDANILLLPYQLNKTSLEAAAKVYRSLHAAKRLVIPAQAAREFVINRASKIGEIVAYLRKEANSLKKPLGDKIGFLDNEADYNELKELASRIAELQAQFRKKAFGIADLLATEVGNDPTSKVYSSLQGAVADYLMDSDGEKAFREELSRRQALRIPPGYKDGKKLQGGPGDLLIWKTILAEGKARKTDCIFVTAEEKSDWWVRNHGAFQPRVELVEEYRTFTGGHTIHVVVLSKLLEIFDVAEETVLIVRQAEEANTAASENDTRALLQNRLDEKPETGILHSHYLTAQLKAVQRRIGLVSSIAKSGDRTAYLQDLISQRDNLQRMLKDIERLRLGYGLSLQDAESE